MLNILFYFGIGLLVCAVVVMILLKHDCIDDDDYDETIHSQDNKIEYNGNKERK